VRSTNGEPRIVLAGSETREGPRQELAAQQRTRDESEDETELRSRIGDAGDAIDRYKAKTAAAVGGGVFLLLLAAGAAYDLLNGKTVLLTALNLSRTQFTYIASGLGLAGFALVGLAFSYERRRDRAGEARLAQMEEELADKLQAKRQGDAPK